MIRLGRNGSEGALKESEQQWGFCHGELSSHTHMTSYTYEEPYFKCTSACVILFHVYAPVQSETGLGKGEYNPAGMVINRLSANHTTNFICLKQLCQSQWSHDHIISKLMQRFKELKEKLFIQYKAAVDNRYYKNQLY